MRPEQQPASYNVRLLFNSELGNRLKTFSQRLALLGSASSILGDGSVPHITLLRFKQEEMDVDRLVESLRQQRFPLPLEVTFGGLWTGEDTDNLTWYGINVERTPELMKLRDDLFNVLGCSATDNACGQDYRPHISLGKISNGEIAKVLEAAKSHMLLAETNVVCTLDAVVFRLGSGYTTVF